MGVTCLACPFQVGSWAWPGESLGLHVPRVEGTV